MAAGKLTLRTTGEYQTRRPLPLARAAGFVIKHSERRKAGIIERGAVNTAH
jgi:hypothetical protein